MNKWDNYWVNAYNFVIAQIINLQDKLHKAKDQNFRRNKLVDNLRREIEELTRTIINMLENKLTQTEQLALLKKFNR